MPTPADGLDPSSMTPDDLSEHERQTRTTDPVSSGLDVVAEGVNAAGVVVDGVSATVELAGSAAGAIADAGGAAVEASGDVLGGVAEAASGCGCAILLLLVVGLSAGAAAAMTFIH